MFNASFRSYNRRDIQNWHKPKISEQQKSVLCTGMYVPTSVVLFAFHKISTFTPTYVHLDEISRSLMAIFVLCRNSIKCGGKSLKHSSTMRWVSPHLLPTPLVVSLLPRADAKRDSVSFCEFTKEISGTKSVISANIFKQFIVTLKRKLPLKVNNYY